VPAARSDARRGAPGGAAGGSASVACLEEAAVDIEGRDASCRDRFADSWPCWASVSAAHGEAGSSCDGGASTTACFDASACHSSCPTSCQASRTCTAALSWLLRTPPETWTSWRRAARSAAMAPLMRTKGRPSAYSAAAARTSCSAEPWSLIAC